MPGFSDDECNYPSRIENLEEKIVRAISHAKSTALVKLKKLIPNLDAFTLDSENAVLVEADADVEANANLDSSDEDEDTDDSDVDSEEEESDADDAGPDAANLNEDSEHGNVVVTEEDVLSLGCDERQASTSHNSNTVENEIPNTERNECRNTEGNECRNTEENEPGNVEGNESLITRSRKMVRGSDGRQYPISQIARNFFGFRHSARAHSRENRFHQNRLYLSHTNNPRGFGIATQLEGNVVKKHEFVLFACHRRKKKGKDAVFIGKVMWFDNHYWTKAKRRSQAKAVASSLDDDVWVKCFKILNEGHLKPCKVSFRKLPLKKVNHPDRIVPVDNQRITGFDKKQFQNIKVDLLRDLASEIEAVNAGRREARKKRIDDMSLPLSLMHKDEVISECKKRLNLNDANISAALKTLGLQLGFSETESDKQLLPTLKEILKHLRVEAAKADGAGGSQT